MCQILIQKTPNVQPRCVDQDCKIASQVQRGPFTLSSARDACKSSGWRPLCAENETCELTGVSGAFWNQVKVRKRNLNVNKKTDAPRFWKMPSETIIDRPVDSLQYGTHSNVIDKYLESTSLNSMQKEQQYILVIDDETSVREVTAEILREANVHTLEAEDGMVGLELFRKYADRIVLVLLDFSMPGLNGGQVLEQMWKIDASVPILFFSGYGQHEIVRRFRRQGTVGFLQKPYSINELLLAVRQNLKRR